MRLSLPLWIMLALALAALLAQWLAEEAYYWGIIEYPNGAGEPSRWVGW